MSDGLNPDFYTFNVPDTPKTRQCYSVHSNQYPKGERVQTLGSVCYDLLNQVALLLDPCVTLDETLAALHHLFRTSPTPYRPGGQVTRKVRSSAHHM